MSEEPKKKCRHCQRPATHFYGGVGYCSDHDDEANESASDEASESGGSSTTASTDQARRCEQCSSHMPGHMHRTRNDAGALVCPLCLNAPQPRWNTARAGRLMNTAGANEFQNREMEAFASIMARDTGGLQRVAHGIGDLMAIRHCPRCGSGDVIAGSDGAVACGYCKLNFTVTVQPQFSAMPQTVDGQPYQDPSSKDTEVQPSVSPFSSDPGATPPPAAPGAAPAAPGAPKPGGDPEADTKAKIDAATGGDPAAPAKPGDPKDPAKPDDDDPAKPKSKNPVPPQFQKKTLRSLALRFADPAARHTVLDDVRAENGLDRWSDQ